MDIRQISILAAKYAYNPSKEKANEVVIAAEPLIEQFAERTCYLNKEDKEDLAQILRLDTYKLLTERWKPDGRPFHFLLLRQLQNKCRNWINNLNQNATLVSHSSRELFDNDITMRLDQQLEASSTVEYLKGELLNSGSALFCRPATCQHVLHVINLLEVGYDSGTIRTMLNLSIGKYRHYVGIAKNIVNNFQTNLDG